MSSGKSSPEMSSDRVAEKQAPLALPESSDSSLETSSDNSSSASLEQKTDSTMVSPTRETSTSGYGGEPSSESGSRLSSLPQDESAATDHSEAGNGSAMASPARGESESAKELPSTSAPDEGKSQTEEAKGQLSSPVECLPSTSSLKSPAATSPSVAHEKSGVDTIARWESPPSTSKDLSPFEQPTDIAPELERLMAPNDQENETARRVVPKPPPFSIPQRAYYVPQPRLVNSNQYTGVRGCIVKFFKAWQAYSIIMSDSIFLVPFQMILITLSISAISMGSFNLYHCPMGEEIPLLILSLGLAGFLAITLRIAFVIYNFYSHLRTCSLFQQRMIRLVNVVFLLLFSGEFYNFFTETPSFNVLHPNYCNPVFHTYSKILNFAVLFLVAVLFAIHGPAYLYNSFHIGRPGIPDDEE